MRFEVKWELKKRINSYKEKRKKKGKKRAKCGKHGLFYTPNRKWAGGGVSRKLRQPGLGYDILQIRDLASIARSNGVSRVCFMRFMSYSSWASAMAVVGVVEIHEYGHFVEISWLMRCPPTWTKDSLQLVKLCHVDVLSSQRLWFARLTMIL